MASPVRAPSSRGRGIAAKPVPTLATMQRRVWGAVIDTAILIVAAGVVGSFLEGITSGVTRVRIDAATGQRTVDAAIALPAWLPLALFVVFTAAYTITLMATWGRTLGGWAVGIRCVRADSGQRPGWALSTRRWFTLYGAAGLLAFAPVIGPFAWMLTLVVGLSPLWDSTHRLRGYADHLGRDIVVMAERTSPRS
jgi:hypothetical protein